MKPKISVIVAARNMERELPRTLYTLSPSYQREVDGTEYEVVVVDCGSYHPIETATVTQFGHNFRLIRQDDSPSPAQSINYAVRQTSTEIVMICIDGARMLSPGILSLTLAAFSAYANPVVATLALHLGPKIQKLSMLEGYCQSKEDQLLESVDWRNDGYELFRISALAGSSSRGWFMPLAESNCIGMRRVAYDQLHGLDERFQTPGGGFVNLDFYRRACEYAKDLILLLGEATFHQFHGGAATNKHPDHPVRKTFSEEYRELKLNDYEFIQRPTIYLGSVPPQVRTFLEKSVSELLYQP